MNDFDPITLQDGDVKDESLIKRIKCLFTRDCIVRDIPYRDENGDYNLPITSENGETNRFTDHHLIKNAAKYKPDAECIVNVILEEISRISPFSQDLQIKFKSKNGWKGYLKIWLYPQIYYGKPSGSKTDFSEIFLVEKDPTFLNWENIYYLDSSDTGSYEIYLNTLDKWDRYCNHISGICLVSWLDFVK